MLRWTAILIRLLNIFNWVAAVAFVVLIAASIFAEPLFLAALEPRYGARSRALLTDMRLVLAIGIAVAPAAWVVLNRLSAILASVEAGEAFVAENGRRLRQIAWAWLAIQIADLFFGVVAVRVSAGSGEYLGWSPSIGGWIAVLLLFVLAEVWTQGAAMRDELDATV